MDRLSEGLFDTLPRRLCIADRNGMRAGASA
jgi:hypothetical protein